MQIFPLSEGSFTIDHDKIFRPFHNGADELNERPVGSLLVEVQPFLVKTSCDLLLLDAGLGFTEAGNLKLHEQIRKAGFSPGEVTKVLMTHLHKDHAGGLAEITPEGWASAFPQAAHYIQEAEMEEALQPDHKSYDGARLQWLRHHPQLQLLRGHGSIDGYIRYELSGGHSRFHQVFWIREQGQTIFFGGDEAPQRGQLRKRYVAKYDFDGKRASELRQQWWTEGQEKVWTFLFYHDIRMPVWPAP